MKRTLVAYVMATVAVSLIATVAVAWAGLDWTSTDLDAAATFALLGFVTELLSYRRRGGTTGGSVAFLPYVSAVLYSPSVVVVAAVFPAVIAANILQGKAFIKTLFNAAQFTTATALAALVLVPSGGLVAREMSMAMAGMAVLAALAFFTVNSLLVAGAVSIAEHRMFRPTWQRFVESTFVYDVLAVPFVCLLAWAYVRGGSVFVLAIVLPMLGLRQLYKQNAQLEKVTEELLQLMVFAIEARDPYTSGHSRRVSAYSRIIARGARLSSRQIDRVGAAALLHDVGKIHEVYAPILRKPDRLTPEEIAVIQTHPLKSAELVAKVTQLQELVPAVRAHHERWDGLGYPDRLRGDQIPIGARIIALADTIDAMRTSRPYRSAMDTDAIHSEIERGRGSQFDPALASSLLTDTVWRRLLVAMHRFEGLPSSDDVPVDDLEPALMQRE